MVPKGQMAFYVGSKQQTGTEIQKAGLEGGKVYGLKVDGCQLEPDCIALGLDFESRPFYLVELPDVSNHTDGRQQRSDYGALGCTYFNVVEDGAWTNDGTSFIFATTIYPSTWRLDFDDLTALGQSDPEAVRGTIRRIDSGDPRVATPAPGERGRSYDNLCMGETDDYYYVVEDELDPRLWKASTEGGQRELLGHVDISTPGELSGIVTCAEALGPGWGLLDHMADDSSTVQLMAFWDRSKAVPVAPVITRLTAVQEDSTSIRITCDAYDPNNVGGLGVEELKWTYSVDGKVVSNRRSDNVVFLEATGLASVLVECTVSKRGNANALVTSKQTTVTVVRSVCTQDGLCAGDENCITCPTDCQGRLQGPTIFRFCCSGEALCTGEGCQESSCSSNQDLGDFGDCICDSILRKHDCRKCSGCSWDNKEQQCGPV